MEYYLQNKLIEDKRFNKYLKENSYHIKYLNRNPESYKDFIKTMQELHKERPVDKISDAVNTLDIVSSVINTLK